MAKPLKALILEDRPCDADLLLHALKRDGYEVTYERVQDALAYQAALDREPWDIILADYSMPQFSAPQALELLLQRGVDIPFLVITGSISEEVAVACIKKGAADYLLKDRLARLGAAVGQALESRLQRAQQRQAEEALKLTQHAVDHSPVAVFRIALDGRTEYANAAACRSLGYTASELRSMVVSDYDPTWTREKWSAKSQDMQEFQDATLESIHQRKDGSTFPVEVSTSFIKYGGRSYFVCFVADITERKRNQALLVESEKLRTVAGLAAGVAHEINNPLGSMVQNAQVIVNRLIQDLPANNQAASRQGIEFAAVRGFMQDRGIPEMLESIRRSGERAAHTVRNLLTYSRRDAGTTRIDMRELIEQTLALARSDYELRQQNGLADVEIVREFGDDTPVIACSHSQMQQVLLNLIRNAVQAMRSGHASGPARLHLRTFRQGGFGCFEIEDNGPGIPPEIRSRLFEPFFTTKAVGDGTGLGLFVCYHIVTVTHGGQIAVTSAVGCKTCFTVRLPLKETLGVGA